MKKKVFAFKWNGSNENEGPTWLTDAMKRGDFLVRRKNRKLWAEIGTGKLKMIAYPDHIIARRADGMIFCANEKCFHKFYEIVDGMDMLKEAIARREAADVR